MRKTTSYPFRIAAVLIGLLIAASAAYGADKDMSAQDRQMYEYAKGMSKEISKSLEGWVKSQKVSEAQLFSRLYYPIANTDPVKFHTDWDHISDEEIQPILEKYLRKDGNLVFTVLVDVNGYLPTHNVRYSQPLTGNRAEDLVNNRAKRIFADQVGLAAAKNTDPVLIQKYYRDTGEQLADLSVPVYVNGEHWGAVRMGYRIVN